MLCRMAPLALGGFPREAVTHPHVGHSWGITPSSSKMGRAGWGRAACPSCAPMGTAWPRGQPVAVTGNILTPRFSLQQLAVPRLNPQPHHPPLIHPPSYLPCLLKALLVCAVNDINLPGGTKGTVGSPSLPLPAAGAPLRQGSGTHQQVGAAQVLPPVGADGALPPDVPDVELEAVRVDALDVEPLRGEPNPGVTQGPASRGPASPGPQQPLPGWG